MEPSSSEPLVRGGQVYIKAFWDLYNHAGPLFGLGLIWLFVSLPFIITAFLVYGQFPGLSLGLVLLIPLLKCNPGSVALTVCGHRIIYGHRPAGPRYFFRAWRTALFPSLAWLAVYLVAGSGLYYTARHTLTVTAGGFRPALVLPALQLVVYLVLLLLQVFYAPQEAFRHRRLPELMWQSLLLLSGNITLTAAVLLTETVLAFATIRFGLAGLIFMPISVVLGLNLLYYMYGMFGKMEKVTMPGNRFRELLRPFGSRRS